MRTIKFRVWDEEYKRMIYPIGIDWENQFTKDGLTVYYWRNDKNGVSKNGTPCAKEYCCIEQFTGLHDKDGKEIYEGDIAEFLGEFYQVIYMEQYASFMLLHSNGNDLKNIYTSEKIIGNIHENPELLK